MKINDYSIDTLQDWEATFKDIYEKKFEARPVCTAQDHPSSKGARNLGCCSESYGGSLQCWKIISDPTEAGANVDNGGDAQKFCFAASKIVTSDSRYCASKSECEANVR